MIISYRLRLAACLILVYSGFSLSCGKTGEEDTSAPVRQEIVLARINEEPVYLADFKRHIQTVLDDDLDDTQTLSTREMLDEYITQRILLKEADKAGIEITDAELLQHINEWADAEETENAQGIEESVREFLKIHKFLKQKVDLELNITLQELINYYDQNIEGFSVGDQAHVLEILTEERSQAEELRARINNGDSRKFREMARMFSRGATAENEGDLGFFEKGDLPEEFDKVIFALKPGEISEPFQTSHGYHLFFLEEWIPRHQYKFHEVKAEIFRIMAAEKERRQTKEYINSLRNQYSITIHESNIPLAAKEYDFDENES